MKKKKRWWIIPICIGSVLLVTAAAIPLAAILTIKTNKKEITKKYTLNEIKDMKDNSFVPLNDVSYPSTELKEGTVSDEYRNSILDFTNLFTSNMEDFSYSPLNLYASYDTLSWGSDDVTLTNRFNNVLGLDREKRQDNFKSLYPLDYYLNEQGSLQMYQGMFYRNDMSPSTIALEKMTERYSDLYSVDFNSERGIKSMLSWIDKRLNEKNYLSKEELAIKSNTISFLFNTLYFQGKWSTKFNKNKTSQGTFHRQDGTTEKANFMNHEYYSKIYEYETYYSFYDSYKNGETIQYLIAKDAEDDIRKLVKDINFYKETAEEKTAIVDLSLPKFRETRKTDFLPVLEKVGLGNLLDIEKPSLNNFYSNLEDDTAYLQNSFQKNSVVFEEDGTTVKSLGVLTYGDAAAPQNVYQFKLDHPFIYTIYDRFGIPIYTSYVKEL